MNIKILCIFILVVQSAFCAENKEPHRHSNTRTHHRSHPSGDITINIESPTPPQQSYNDLVEEHRIQLKRTKIKVAGLTTVATGLISGLVALLIHYTSSGCATK